jgi:hypothetical protein
VFLFVSLSKIQKKSFSVKRSLSHQVKTKPFESSWIGDNQKWSPWCKVRKIFLSLSRVMLMSFWDSKEPWCHRLRLYGNLGAYQGIVSSFDLLYLGGCEYETGYTLLMLMLAASSVRIMRKAIVTFSLLAVGYPSCGWRLNLSFGSAGIYTQLVVLFGASISRGKTLLL